MSDDDFRDFRDYNDYLGTVFGMSRAQIRAKLDAEIKERGPVVLDKPARIWGAMIADLTKPEPLIR